MLRDANDNVIVVQMETQSKMSGAMLVEAPIAFPARICAKCRSVFVPGTVSESFKLKGSPEGHLTR
jgi:hypothetical protein